MRRAAKLSVMGLAALTIAGCSSTQIRTDFDPRASFRAMRTYQWVDQPVTTARHPAMNSPLVAERIQNAVDAQLAAHGYRRVEITPPDFKITYYMIADEKVDISTTNGGYGYGHRYYNNYYYGYPYAGSTTYADSFLQGTLVLDVIDPETNDVIWRGWATKDLDDNPTPEEVDRYVKNSVRRILERFPPKD